MQDQVIDLLVRFFFSLIFQQEELKLIREQLKIARNELARIQEQTSKGFG